MLHGPFCFAAAISFFFLFCSAPILRGRSVDHHQFLTHARSLPKFTKLGQKSATPHPQKMAAQNIKICHKFRTTSQLDREYLRKETRYRRTKNGVADCSLSCARAVNLVNFGSQAVTRNTLDCDQSNYSSRIVFSHIPIEFWSNRN